MKADLKRIERPPDVKLGLVLQEHPQVAGQLVLERVGKGRLGDRLACVSIQGGLGIEALEMAGAADHEQPDDVLGPRGEMRPPVGRLPAGCPRVIRPRKAIAMQHRRQRHGREPHPQIGEEPSSRDRRASWPADPPDKRASGDDLPDRFAEIDFQPLVAWNFEPARVEAELVQERGVDVGHVMTIFDGVEADLVGRAMDDAALDPAAGHPDREAERMMVAAVAALRAGRSAELGRPDDDRLVEQPALLQIGAASPAIGRSTWAH